MIKIKLFNSRQTLAVCLLNAILMVACGGSEKTITVSSPLLFNISGSITGLGADQNLTLRNNGTENLVLSAGVTSFKFPTKVVSGSTYAVTIESQPEQQNCIVSYGDGIISDEHINNIEVNCTNNTFTVSGSVAGLIAGSQLKLLNSGTDRITLHDNDTSFEFPTKLVKNSEYNITIEIQPKLQNCTVSNGSGFIIDKDIQNIQINCSTTAFTVGGTVVGIAAGKDLTLLNNNTDPLVLSTDSDFQFNTPVAAGASYNLTVKNHPAGQVCAATNPEGKNITKNMTNIAIFCESAAKGLNLAWHDEFNHLNINEKIWTVANTVRDNALRSPKSVNLINGYLDLRVFNKPDNSGYQSGFILTKNKFNFMYGYIESKIKFKSQPAQWSAFWLQSDGNILRTPEDPSLGTEIDIIEHRAIDATNKNIENSFVTNIHWNGYGTLHRSYGSGTKFLPTGQSFSDWKILGLRWTPTSYTFYVDGKQYFTSARSISQSNQFIMLTNEIRTNSWAGLIPTGGYGDFGSDKNGWMQVDWVRLWQ
jgi:beta-glucanase (GH16 family)